MSDIIAFLISGGMFLLAAVGYLAARGANKSKQLNDERKATKTVTNARTEARAASDERLNKEVDKWTRN